MGQIDPLLQFQSKAIQEEWKTPTEIPTSAVFTKELDMKHEAKMKQTTCVSAFLTIYSMLCLNTIKFDNKVYAYLRQHNVYIQLCPGPTSQPPYPGP
eukprot:1125902-Ditylum_brightwellii.AAC.1